MTFDTSLRSSVTCVTSTSTPALDEVGAQLLRSANELLSKEGPGALTVRRIAADAGMSTMNVYSRFGGKDGVVEHLFLQGFVLLAEAMEGTALTDDPVADLRASGRAYRQFAIEHTALYSVMFDRVVPDYVPSESALSVAAHTLQLLADRIQRCVEAGRFRSAPSMELAAIVWATCHGVVSLELRDVNPANIDWATVFDHACATIVVGLSA
jgi:AcrR family transcriptional regulator